MGYPAVIANNWLGVDGSNYIQLNEPWPAMAINQQTPEDAYNAVLDNAGTVLPKRDALDSKIIEETRGGFATYEGDAYKKEHEVADPSKTTGIIDSQSEVGRWPELKSSAAPADFDHDGMPDTWESKFGLDPKDVSAISS